jgi:hypothetical protein
VALSQPPLLLYGKVPHPIHPDPSLLITLPFEKRLKACISIWGDYSTYMNLSTEKYQLVKQVASEEGVNLIDILALWRTEQNFRTSFKPGRDGDTGPLQIRQTAINDLIRTERYGSELDDWASDVEANLRAGTRYFNLIQDLYVPHFGAPYTQAYSIYNGHSNWNGSQAQKNQKRFDRYRNMLSEIVDCAEE